MLTAAVCSVLLAGFVVAYYGKEHQYRFTPEEVAAATFLYDTSPRGTEIIQGTNNYPVQFKRYEQFRYLTMADEPVDTHRELWDDPVGVVTRWMSSSRGGTSRLIITRSQMAEVDELGVMRPGTLGRVQRALLASGRFDVVYRNRDAVILAPARRTMAVAP